MVLDCSLAERETMIESRKESKEKENKWWVLLLASTRVLDDRSRVHVG